MNLKYTILSVLIAISISVKSYSETIILSDSARISLLTNSPWEKEIYALFGHTGLRVQDTSNGLDYVFNYGLFDFSSPDFIYRFVKGETDYMVGAIPYRFYIEEYQNREVSTVEQILNLTQSEKQKVWDALCINSLPQNRVYRYNFFYDNCSTRPRDIIEQNIDGVIDYTPTNKKETYRDLLHGHLIFHSWTRFGIDLVIGSDADKLATDREKMFLPLFLENAYINAVIVNKDGSVRKLVNSQHYLTEFPNHHPESFAPDCPYFAGCILLVISIIITFFTFRRKLLNIGKVFDTLLFGVAGITGCVIAFLMFASEHPATNPNWNIIWLNPLQLIVAALIFVKSLSKYINYYHFINFALLSLFLMFWWLIPQGLEIAFIPFVLSLWLRSGTNFVQYKKFKRR